MHDRSPFQSWCRGGKVFPSFVQFLKSDDSEAADKQAALEAELGSLNDHLAQNGPFLKGGNISAGDLALAPKLYHLQIALRELKVSRGSDVACQHCEAPEHLRASAVPACYSLFPQTVLSKSSR